jgi:hypothetical protein
MTMHRYNVAWQNWPGAPGLSVFFTDPAAGNPDPAPLRTFWNTLAGQIPSGLTVQVPASGDLVEESTGQLSGTWSATPTPAVVTGTGTGVYAGNAGAVIHWLTGDVVNGRRVRGRTFLVPLIGSGFESNGSLSSATITALTSACTTLLASSTWHPVVWARPFKGTVKNPTTRVGSKHAVTGFRIPDLAVSLRSRRI